MLVDARFNPLQEVEKMHSALVVFLLAVISLTSGFDEEMQELIDNLHNTCVSEVGVDEALIKNAQNGDFAEDEKLMCYTKCLMDQMAIVDDNGILDPEAALAILPADMQTEAGPVVHKCSKLRGSSPCNTVFEVMKCWYKESPGTYFMP